LAAPRYSTQEWRIAFVEGEAQPRPGKNGGRTEWCFCAGRGLLPSLPTLAGTAGGQARKAGIEASVENRSRSRGTRVPRGEGLKVAEVAEECVEAHGSRTKGRIRRQRCEEGELVGR
jgi:hypothetical protein